MVSIIARDLEGSLFGAGVVFLSDTVGGRVPHPFRAVAKRVGDGDRWCPKNVGLRHEPKGITRGRKSLLPLASAITLLYLPLCARVQRSSVQSISYSELGTLVLAMYTQEGNVRLFEIQPHKRNPGPKRKQA